MYKKNAWLVIDANQASNPLLLLKIDKDIQSPGKAGLQIK